MSLIRILGVDDYEPFRRFVCSTLEQRPDLRVICEVSDGLEAVQKAGELQPDLILLDIGLPTLNGLEAARRIRKFSPKSKILFVSQESSAAVVQEAFSLGAMGYLVKAHAGSELLAAVEAVRQGKKFVSSGLSGHIFTEAMSGQAPNNLYHKEALPSLALGRDKITRSHEVEFYPDDASFVAGFARFVGAALKAGNPAIVVATESHRKDLLQSLQGHGVDIGVAIEQGRYIPLDVAGMLSSFMVDDLPDPVRFLRVVGDLITRVTAVGQSRVAACGECAAILWAQGKADAAIQVEQLCNQLTKRYEMDILCGFSLSSFYREEDKQVFQRICSEC